MILQRGKVGHRRRFGPPEVNLRWAFFFLVNTSKHERLPIEFVVLSSDTVMSDERVDSTLVRT